MGETIRLSVTADSSVAVKEMRRTTAEAQHMGRSVETIGSKIGTGLKTAAKVGFTAVAVGAAAVVVGLGKAAQAATTMADSVDATKVVFGSASAEVEKFATGAAKSLGLSKQEALDASQTLGTLGKVAGLQGPNLSKFSNDMVQLGGDMASLKGGTATEAVQAIGAALRGESEPIRKYGIILDEASVKAQAFSMGLVKGTADKSKVASAQLALMTAQKNLNKVNSGGVADATKLKQAQLGLMTAQEAAAKVNADEKATASDRQQAALRLSIAQEKLTKANQGGTVSEEDKAIAVQKVTIAQAKLKAATEGKVGALTQEQKVLATQALIMKQGADAHGNFGDTIESAKNQQEIFKASSANLSAELGKSMLPAMQSLYRVANDKLFPVFERLVTKHGPKLEAVFSKLGNAVGDFVAGHVDEIDRFFNAVITWVLQLDFSKIGKFFDGLRDGSEGVGPALKDLGPALTDLKNGFKDLGGDTVTVAGAALKFFADNIDLLVKLLPVLIGAFLLHKAAQSASSVAAAVNIPLQIITIANNFILARSNNALAAALNYSTGATKQGTLAMIADKAAKLGSAIATGVMAGAQRLATVAQWLFNGSLLACPITWIILGIAAVIVIVILLVKNWGKVTEALGFLWRKIKDGFSWLKSNWQLVLAILTGPIGLAVLAITKHFDTIIGFFTGIPDRISTAVHGMWDPIAIGFKNMINWIIDAWNKLELTIPPVDTDIPGVGNVGGFSMKTPNIPRMATGGTVTRDGLAYLHAAEVVTPAGKSGTGDTYNISVTAAPFANPAEIGRQIVRAIEAHDRVAGTRSLIA